VEVKDNAAVKTLAPKLIADWQDVPAMADVVKQAKEMLQAAGGAAAVLTTNKSGNSMGK